MLERIRAGLRSAASGAFTYAESAVNESVVRVAVTGLSRSGKTVFITSLIHNLLALSQGRNTLPQFQKFLNSEGSSRLRNIRILPSGTSTTPYFDFATKLADLAADAPAWPPRTDDLSELAISMELERRGALTQKLGVRRIRLELLDYPGEWLLDLPLLSQTFSSWSRETLQRLRRPTQAAACAPFLDFLNSISATDTADDAFIRRGHQLYRSALDECRSRFGMRYLQPGRFVCPGPRSDAPFLWFFPLENAQDYPVAGTVDALMRDRFETYKTDMKTNFFDTHFTKFDRQILLVDILGALYAGKESFEDTEKAIGDIVNSLHYGTNVLPRPLQDMSAAAIRVGGHLLRAKYFISSKSIDEAALSAETRRIERLAIVATKSDHVPAMRRENLKNLVRDLANTERMQQTLTGMPVTYHAASAVHSTTDGIAHVDGRPVEVVMGIPLGEERARPFYPGDVPSGRPPLSFWSDRYFELPVFAPPRLDPTGEMGIPHLCMDEVLLSLLRDVLT